ncbi:MAG: RING finger protein [Candidatus Babeliales bacterium]
MSFKKIALIFYLSLGLFTTAHPIIAAPAIDNMDKIEFVTAIALLPCGILEYDLRNDPSCSAHIKKAVIHAIRLLNVLLTDNTMLHKTVNWPACKEAVTGTTVWHHLLGWGIYDAVKVINELRACKKQVGQGHPSALAANAELLISDVGEYENLRRFILPTVEMICALARTKYFSRQMPVGSNKIASMGVSMARLGELYFEAANNSTQRKIIGGLLVACVVELLVKTNRLVDEAAHRERERLQRVAAQQAVDVRVAALVEGQRQLLDQQQQVEHVRQEQHRQNLATALLELQDPARQGDLPPANIQRDEDNTCKICHEQYQQPYALRSCGHAFCLNCIVRWLEASKDMCPQCHVHTDCRLYQIDR